MQEYNKTDMDWRISSKVRIALKVHEATEKYMDRIKIGTANRIVHLMGEVPNDQVRVEAERIANGVPDASTIINELKVVH
jgi:osmotically-inducible protein OsmY